MTSFADDLSRYSPARLREDLIAGLTVAMLAAPQAMVYATIANINPVYGLYSAIVVTLVASIFNSCSRLIHGPTNAVSVMIADIGLMHVMDRLQIPPDQFMRVVFLLTLMIGVVQLAGAVFRLGYLTNYISPSVIVGFTVGVAVLIVVTQLPKVFGIPLTEPQHAAEATAAAGADSLTPLRAISHFLRHLGDFQAATLSVGGGCAVFTLLYRAFRRSLVERARTLGAVGRWLGALLFYIPGPLLAIVGAAVATAVFRLDQHGVQLVSIPSGRLPPPSLPLFRVDLARALMPSALAIGFIGMIEAIGTGKSVSRLTRESFNANRQLLAEALSNVAGSFFSGFAGSSSFTRSALNVEVGAATRLAGIFSACFVGLFLILLSPLLDYIPLPALNGVLIAIGVTLIRSQPILRTIRGSRSDAAIMCATALWAVVFSLDGAILLGVVLSILFYMPQAAMLHRRWLIRDEKNLVREKAPGEPDCSRLAILDLEGELFFGAIPSLESVFIEIAADPRKEKILRIHNTHHVDAAAASALVEFARSEQARGNRLTLCGIRPQHVEILRRHDLFEVLGSENAFVENNLSRSSTVQAVGAAYLRIGPHRCDLCGHAEREDMEPFTYMI